MAKPTKKQREEDAVVRWVARLNALGRELDGWAACIHPSSWNEQPISDLKAKYKELAARGP